MVCTIESSEDALVVEVLLTVERFGFRGLELILLFKQCVVFLFNKPSRRKIHGAWSQTWCQGYNH
jgi:hypothetical protein